MDAGGRAPRAAGKYSRRLVAGQVATGAIYGALIPIVALVTMEPSAYGEFSLLYLIAALGLSLQLSTVSEPWARRRLGDVRYDDHVGYVSTLHFLAAATGAAMFALALFRLESVPSGLAIAVAGTGAVARTGLRYRWTATGGLWRVILGDVGGLAAFVLAFAGAGRVGEFGRMAAAWAASAVVSTLLMSSRSTSRFGAVRTWFAVHGRSIRSLLGDSLLMDLSAIGTPLLVAPVLGATDFGIYRGVSNVAMPVRLVLDPMRPLIGASLPGRWHSVRGLLTNGTITVIFGVAAYVALAHGLAIYRGELGTLSALAVHALPIGIFVGCNYLGHFYYMVARTRASARAVGHGRLIQTVSGVILPVVGVATGGLSAGIWGYVVATLVSALAWVGLSHNTTGASRRT